MALKDEQAQQNGVGHETRGHETRGHEARDREPREIRSIQENVAPLDAPLPRPIAARPPIVPEPEPPTETLISASVPQPLAPTPVEPPPASEEHEELVDMHSEKNEAAGDEIRPLPIPPLSVNGAHGDHGDHQAEIHAAPSAFEEAARQEPPTKPARNSPPAPPIHLDPTVLNAVKIKGRAGGVLVEIGEGVWQEMEAALEARLDSAEGFFRGARVVLDLAARTVGGEELRAVARLLEAQEMKLTIVRATSEQTLRAASDMGLITSIEDVDPGVEVDSRPAVKPAGQGRPSHYVHRGHLRSGQVLKRYESIVVLGDVNPGAQVISAGDIVIWGRLRGVAFAGADGNRRATVAALDFSPNQLRIANLAAVAPDQAKPRRSVFFWQKEPPRKPEVARIAENRIVVEPWDDGRPGPGGARRKLTS